MGRLVCFGDSNTFGYDPCSYFGDSYPAGVRFSDRLPDAWEVINLGQNGLSIPREGNFRACCAYIRRQTPDLLFVMLGTNDLLQGALAETCAARMEAFLRYLAENDAAERMLLIAPPLLKEGTWVSREAYAQSRRIGALYRACAGRIAVSFADAGEWEIPTAYDGVHFTEEGHARFAEKLSAILQECESSGC